MTDNQILDIIILLIPVLAIVLGGLSPAYLAIKKMVLDAAKALEDDVITKAELIQFLENLFNIVNIFKYIFRRK